MATSSVRDDELLVAGVERWSQRRVAALERPSAGWSSETVVVTYDDGERVVVRLPPLVASFPDDLLAPQAHVMTVLEGAGVPVPHVVALVDDPAFLGAPFLVMAFVVGRAPGDAPGLDPWVAEAPATVQRHMHDRFINLLASVHLVRWQEAGLADVLRVGTAAEVQYWTEYAHWAADGVPAGALVDALRWCATTVPDDERAPSLLWGDARLGNVVFEATKKRRDVIAALDWELASIGPAEMDLAWYLALDALTVKVTGAPVEGFLSREGVIARHEARLGRTVRDLAWHEIFALTRSICINDRQARIARQTGVEYPGIAGDDNPMLGVVARRIERFGN
jgi:aminoglycoside phosphotransferase (APT) family kinase protein